MCKFNIYPSAVNTVIGFRDGRKIYLGVKDEEPQVVAMLTEEGERVEFNEISPRKEGGWSQGGAHDQYQLFVFSPSNDNGLQWYVNVVIRKPNKSPEYDPRNLTF